MIQRVFKRRILLAEDKWREVWEITHSRCPLYHHHYHQHQPNILDLTEEN